MSEYIQYLAELIPEKDSLKLVKNEAAKFYKTHSLDECFYMGHELYKSDNFQIQEVGVFLFGYAAHENADALSFLKNTVSQNDSWKVQEILAMAFDNHCNIIGYETALPTIQEWLDSDCANVRRAVSEGLRIWTSRPYFKDNPRAAIELLAAHKSDESAYVRKSIGNAIRDISKKHNKLVFAELSTWDLSSKEIRQVYKLASKFLDIDKK
ncbi:DNA alkylation repair protein [Lachnospiraceae bacterium 45-P1]